MCKTHLATCCGGTCRVRKPEIFNKDCSRSCELQHQQPNSSEAASATVMEHNGNSSSGRVCASAWLTVSWVHLGKLCLLSSVHGKNACDPVLKECADGSRFPWNTKRKECFSHDWRWQANTRGTAGFRRRCWQSSEFSGWWFVHCVSVCHLSHTSEHGTNRQPKEKKVSLVTEFQVKSATPTSLWRIRAAEILYITFYFIPGRAAALYDLAIWTYSPSADCDTGITVPAVKRIIKAHMSSLLVSNAGHSLQIRTLEEKQ